MDKMCCVNSPFLLFLITSVGSSILTLVYLTPVVCYALTLHVVYWVNVRVENIGF